MRVLVVVGSDLQLNTSANLCHKAYIQGLIDNNCIVDVLTAGKNAKIEHSARGKITYYYYPQQSLYEKFGNRVKRNNTQGEQNNRDPDNNIQSKGAGGLAYKIKREVHALYGPYEVYIVWERKARSFYSEKDYDFVVSLSFPPVGHYLVYKLMKEKHVKAARWIQIWEDPWYHDLVFRSLNDEKAIQRAKKEEARLLRVADKVLYVSPITLSHQADTFSEYANKMQWLPVPTYYPSTEGTINQTNNIYGYFGDYSTKIRNLEPFYVASKQENVLVNICGGSDKMFASSKTITVRPRISLEQLKPIEMNTNVLVFLCNLSGGQIPGKIYQYSATDKTILFILDGTEEEQKVLRDYFGQFNRYVFCQNTVEDIVRAIRDIERGELHGVVNQPLTCFSPKEIVGKILAGIEE